jgi:hypothetical protein
MGLSVEEAKARRLEGLKREQAALTAVERVHRSFVNGRPPASELRTPLAAVTAARTLHRELEARLKAEGLDPQPGDCGVSIAYVTPDLSVLGFTLLFAPGNEPDLMAHLDGNIMLGLVFGLVDDEAGEPSARIIMGARPFITTKQVEAWLQELFPVVRFEVEEAKYVRRNG